MEMLTTLSSDSSTESTNQRSYKLQQLLASDRELVDILKEALHDSIVALPRVVGSNDETKRTRVIEQIQFAFRLLFAQNVDLRALNDLTVSNLRSSIATMVQASSTRTISSVADGSAEVGRILQASTSSSLEQRSFAPVIFDSPSQGSAMAGLQRIARQLQDSAMSIALQQRLIKSLRSTTGFEQLGSLWLMLQLSESSLLSDQEVNRWLDISHDDSEPLKEEAYAFALEVLEESTYEEAADWRLQALSLEVVALQARSQGKDFRPELVDALYPILERMGSSNAALQQHAVTCLSIMSTACGYANAGDLVIDNADYLVNAVAVKLNRFDISPQASQIMLMMVRLCGSTLIPYLDDLIETIFAILASYHGYPRLVEALFEVLNAIVEEAAKSSPQTIESAPEQRQPYKPTTIPDLISRLQSMRSKMPSTDSLP
ncbi:MAG: hypothetical protein L6R39_002695, partial [Caloplaca ligustica]